VAPSAAFFAAVNKAPSWCRSGWTTALGRWTLDADITARLNDAEPRAGRAMDVTNVLDSKARKSPTPADSSLMLARLSALVPETG